MSVPGPGRQEGAGGSGRQVPTCWGAQSPEPAAPTTPGPRGRPSLRAGREVGQAPTGPCPFLHSQPQRRPGHEVLRPDLPQQHRDLGWRGPLRLLLPGQPVPQQRGLGVAGRPRRPGGHRRGQPAVGTAPGNLLSQPSRACPGITRALAACVGSVCSTCLPVYPPCLREPSAWKHPHSAFSWVPGVP